MNIDRKVLMLASLPAIMLCSCNFNEDFCIRNGELVAWCDFNGIKETPPVPQERHIIPFGTDVPPSEGTTFTQDTLRWSLPQGAYKFLFYTGNYEVLDRNDYHETRLSVRTDTIDGEVYISEAQKFCCSSAFSERLEYQNPKRVRIQPTPFVQKLNVKINVSGNTAPLNGLNGTLSGISTARYLASRERSGTASLATPFARKAEGVWTASLYVFGFNPAEENVLVVETRMDEEDSAFNESQSVDLTPYLRGFDGDEISLELNLRIGKELEIGEPVVIPDWEDTPEIEFP